jgi:branched-chain amino acid transport system permease protein
MLPLVLTQYSSELPFLATAGSGGLDAATLSRLLYGAAIIGVLLFLRGGLAGAAGRLRHRGTPLPPDTSGLPPAPPPAPAGTTNSIPSTSRPGVPTRSKETTT